VNDSCVKGKDEKTKSPFKTFLNNVKILVRMQTKNN
jgi:hypothetical protein